MVLIECDYKSKLFGATVPVVLLSGLAGGLKLAGEAVCCVKKNYSHF